MVIDIATRAAAIPGVIISISACAEKRNYFSKAKHAVIIPKATHSESTKQKDKAIVRRRRFQRGSVYMNANKTMWLGAYTEYRLENGIEIRVRKQITLTPTKKGDTKTTKREAQRLLQPYLDAANNPATEMKKSITFSKFSDVWERDYLSLNKPATRQVTQSYLKRLMAAWGNRDMRTIDAGDVQRLIAEMQAEGLVPKSVRNVWSVVSRIWQAAHTQRYVDAVLPKPKLPRNHKKKVRCFTLSDVAQLIARSGRENRVFYWLLAETGLRSGEVAGLTAEDVDLDRQRLTVNRSVYRGREQRPKTDNAVRTLALSSQLTALLREQITLQAAQGATIRLQWT